MERVIRYFYVVIFSFVIAACGGGGGGGSNPPADAAKFTSDNAVSFARESFALIDFADLATDLAFKSETNNPFKGAVKLTIDQIFKQRTAQKLLAGRSETLLCGDNASFGSITYSTTETSNSESGSIVFDQCNFNGSGIVIDGGFSFSGTFDDFTQDYSAMGEGSITFSFDTDEFTIAMDFDVSGNDSTGEFTETFNFSVTGYAGGGFSLATTDPITGFDPDVTGGQIVLSGADNTRIRVTVVGINLVDIELDDGSGNFAPYLSGVSLDDSVP